MHKQLVKLEPFFTSIHKKEKVKDLPMLLERLSILLKEGYSFSDAIHLLLPFHVENVDQFRHLINKKLRSGVNIVEIFQSLSVPKHYLVAIAIAEESGDLSAALQNISKQMAFNVEMAKKLRRLLTYPLMLLLFISMIFIAFRTYFLPNIERIIQSRTSTSEGSLAITSLFLHVPDVLLFSFLFLFVGTFLFVLYLKRQSIEQQLSIILKIPIIRYFYKLHITRQFARYVGSLLDGGFSLQHILHILQQQQFNKRLSYISMNIEKRIVYGESLEHAVKLTPFFFSKFEVFIHHGEKSGHLGKELLIYCELLDDKLQSYIRTAIGIVQPILFAVIAICIIAAYLSVLMPMYRLIEII